MTKSRPDLAALKAAAEKATPGLWGQEDEVNHHCMVTAGRLADGAFIYVADTSYSTSAEEDAGLIVALHNAFPALCETLERYEAALNLLRDRAVPHGWVWHLADRALAGEK